MKYLLSILIILLSCFCLCKAQSKNVQTIHERIYLHTDRTVYIAGDNLFYTLYLIGNQGQMSKYAYLTLRDRNNLPVTRIRVDIKNQKALGNIYLPDTLRTDIYQIVCFTNYMRNDGEDYYFKKEILVANRFDKKLELSDSTNHAEHSSALTGQDFANENKNGNLLVHLDKRKFGTREKVLFSIQTKDNLADTITRVSVSVNEIVPGIPNDPAISDYFNSMNKRSIASEPKQDHNHYYLEAEGSVIEGRVISKPLTGNQSPTASQSTENDNNSFMLFVSTPDSIANMQYTSTDSLGTFCIFLNKYYDGKEIIIRLKNDTRAEIEPDYKFELNKPFVPSNSFNKAEIESYIVRSRNIAEVQRYYNEKPEIISLSVAKNASGIPRVYYKPHTRIFPADYLPLPDFVEITRELLPGFRVRKSNENYIMSFIDAKNKGLLNIEPKIFLDGVLIDDVNQIINLGTNKLKRLEMLPVIRYYGEMPLWGILAVFSKNQEINNIQFKTPAIRYHALLSQNYTIPQKYIPNDIDNHLPDVRQLLLWDPEIVLHKREKLQIEFYTSDLRGNYLINVQGLTSNGLPVNGSAIITVKSKSN